MFNNIFESSEVRDLLREIVNNPRYYDKEVEEILKNDFFVHSRVLFLYYDALYKFQLIINDNEYLDEYIHGIEMLLKKVDDIQNIKYGISKLLGRLVSNKLNLSIEENRYEILKYVYDSYIKNGYYIRGVSKIDFININTNGLVNNIIDDDMNSLNNIFSNYDFNLIDEEDNKIIFNTDFSISCTKSINTPRVLYDLVVNNKYVNNKDAYYLKDRDKCLSNLDIVLNELRVDNKSSVKKIFNDIWDKYNSKDNNIYLLFIKRNKLVDIDDYKDNDSFSFDDALFNIFSTYDDYIEVDSNTSIDYFIELPSYNKYLKSINTQENKDEKKYTIDNEYGKASVFMILGSILIILGVLLTILFI